MTDFRAAWTAEVRKAARSWVPAVTLAVFTLAPCIGALFMFIIADPDRARRFGLLNQKAQLSGLTADWPGMLAFAAQVVAVGALMLFAFINTWLFGREFADGTARYLMALPVSRSTIVTAKLALFTLWAGLLTLWVAGVTLLLGWIMGLPGWTTNVGVSGVGHALISGSLMIPAIMPIAYIASRTRGYLPALATAIGLVALAQVVAVLGWAAYFPWAIPAIAAGLVPDQHLAPVSVAISLATGAIGITATIRWWRSPDAGL